MSDLATLAQRLANVASSESRARATEAARTYLDGVARAAVAGHVRSGKLVGTTEVQSSGDGVLDLITADRPSKSGTAQYMKYVTRVGYGFARTDRAEAVRRYVDALKEGL